ncbi:MAG: SpoIIE family protein phosphatase [Bacteroidales bacterium]|nr:SpoIIE family protein phosphatase [Bacteroidales bacterium]
MQELSTMGIGFIPLIELVGTTVYHYIAYFALLLGLIYLIARYQTITLLKTRRLLREKETAYEEIARQRQELENKNRSITDSLIYASYMQQALLPSEEYFKSILPDSFIFFRPKDIVSGDFYWIAKKGGKIFVVAADCTGHGVPGAFLSMIGVELLNKIILDQGIQKPSTILKILGRGIERTFGSSNNSRALIIKDGMDIGLCVIDEKKGELQYSGAFLPLYLIRDNKLTEIKGEKLTIGLPGELSFINHSMKIEQGDVIYLFSDGYTDQFGGPYNKKFMYRRFRHLLLTIHKFPLVEQQTIIEESITSWRQGDEQVDDMLVIGIKPSLTDLPVH